MQNCPEDGVSRWNTQYINQFKPTVMWSFPATHMDKWGVISRIATLPSHL